MPTSSSGRRSRPRRPGICGPPDRCTSAPRTTSPRPSGCRAPLTRTAGPIYQRSLDLLQKSFELTDPGTTRVEIPYEGTTLPAYFTDASPDGPRARHDHVERARLDEGAHVQAPGWPHELAARGISTLMVDCPGSGEALRLRGLTARVDTEAWATACVDYLETRDDVDPTGSGWSAGHSAATTLRAPPRSRSGSPSCVAWGANHDWGAGAATPAGARRREPGTALLGARPVGVGRARHRHVHRQGRGGQPRRRGRADHRAVPDPPRRERPADPGRLRAPLLRAGGQQPQARAADLQPPTRAPPNTSASTTCPTSVPSSPTGSRTASTSWPVPDAGSRRVAGAPGLAATLQPPIEGIAPVASPTRVAASPSARAASS